MSPAKLLVAASIVVLLCASSLGFSQRRDSSSIGDPRHSWLRVLADAYPERALKPSDLRGISCFSGQEFTVNEAGCQVAIPDGVKRVLIQWSAASNGITVTLTRPGSLQQKYTPADQPQDPQRRDSVSMPVLGKRTTMTLLCVSATPCIVVLR